MSIDPTRRSLLGTALIAAAMPPVPALASPAAQRAMISLMTVRTDVPPQAPVTFLQAMLAMARP